MELLSSKLQRKETENLGRRGSAREFIFTSAINDKQMTMRAERKMIQNEEKLAGIQQAYLPLPLTVGKRKRARLGQ